MACTVPWILAGGALLTSACDPASPPSAAVRDSAGVTVVEAPPGSEPGNAVDLELVLTIGRSGGDSAAEFGDIAAIARLSDGTIAVLDRQARELELFGADGAFRTRIGGPGLGPGALSSEVAGLLVGRGDTLIVPDLGNARVNLYAPTGDVSAFPLRLDQYLPLRFDVSGDGNLVAQLRSPGGLSGTAMRTVDDLVEFRYDGTVRDTLASFERGGSFEPGADVPPVTIFDPEPRWTMLRDGRLATASNTRYRITIGTAGHPERVIQVAQAPRKVTRGDRRRIRARVRDMLVDEAVPTERVARILEDLSVADQWPAFSQLRAGPGGTLWVQRILDRTEVNDDPLADWNPLQLSAVSRQWDIFDSQGRVAGRLELPRGFRLLLIEDGHLYGVYRDGLDVQHVRVYRFRLPVS